MYLISGIGQEARHLPSKNMDASAHAVQFVIITAQVLHSELQAIHVLSALFITVTSVGHDLIHVPL